MKPIWKYLYCLICFVMNCLKIKEISWHILMFISFSTLWITYSSLKILYILVLHVEDIFSLGHFYLPNWDFISNILSWWWIIWLLASSSPNSHYSNISFSFVIYMTMLISLNIIEPSFLQMSGTTRITNIIH